MKCTWAMTLLVIVCGCQPTQPQPTGRVRPSRIVHGPLLVSDVVCTFDVVKIPRVRYHKLEQLWGYTEAGAVYGPDDELLALNGLRIARMDMRFEKQFQETLDSLWGEPRRLTYLRLPEGRQQAFDVGDVLRDETLFVWTKPDAMIGRHFSHARYRMTLGVDRVQGETAELAIAWQVLTGAGLNRTVTIPTLDGHVEMRKRQSVVIGPSGFSGRGVGRAFLSGVEETAVDLTFFVITPTEIRRKAEPPGEAG